MSLETDREIEAILNAMEAASPGSRAEHIGGSFTLNRPRPLHQRTLMRLIMAIDQTLADDLEVLPEPRVRSSGRSDGFATASLRSLGTTAGNRRS